jgi:hypothetical protein
LLSSSAITWVSSCSSTAEASASQLEWPLLPGPRRAAGLLRFRSSGINLSLCLPSSRYKDCQRQISHMGPVRANSLFCQGGPGSRRRPAAEVA